MKKSEISGNELLAMLAKSGVLTSDQVAALNSNRLRAVKRELYHRATVANVGSQTGVALYDIDLETGFGVTNLKKGSRVPFDFVILGLKGKIASIVNAEADALTPAEIKAATFDNLIYNFSSTITEAGAKKRVPELILNSEFKFSVDANEQCSFIARNFFLNAREKRQIEGGSDDILDLPNSFTYVEKDKQLLPTLNLPVGITIPNTNVAQAGNLSYVWETIYVGYEIKIVG